MFLREFRPTLHLSALLAYKKFQIWVRRTGEFGNIFPSYSDLSSFDFNCPMRSLVSNISIIEFPEKLDEADFEVYTDGSRVGDNFGCGLCTFKNNVLSPPFCFKLESFNTVFQVELFAIYFAACWSLENGHKINICTDSLSSIQILRSPNTKSNFVTKIKEKLSKAGGLVGLYWVKTHAGNPSNETADNFARLSTEIGEFKN
ncbi:hypothetical protein AVEN_223475-1 [Araneus ventricosus]|uniref:RNase H type-1 domain-containing protein n=1 Tax=Araneus ventricosus TaxID=182803 RepID=A0A4Y2EXF2_ARAVE|nr:hypothetical protein AVEN_223475-1 [Araneus ventricosus]